MIVLTEKLEETIIPKVKAVKGSNAEGLSKSFMKVRRNQSARALKVLFCFLREPAGEIFNFHFFAISTL